MAKAKPKKRRSNGLSQALGGLAGMYLGGPAGGMIGSTAGKLVSQITGYGDYKVNRNTLVSGNSVPSFSQGGDGIRIHHKEFLFDVVGSTLFNLTALSINPGVSSTFPWLSLLAQNFEEYEMNGLVFVYKPSSGAAVSSTSSALGIVVLATDYDVLNPNFVDKQQMESYEFASSTVPFQECLHPVECARRRNVLDNLYVRTTKVPSFADARLYDMGSFQIATQGMQTAYTVGELWITYDVTLRKPRINQFPGTVYYAHAREFPTLTSSSLTCFGSGGGLLEPNSTLPGVSIANDSTLLLAAEGNYFVVMQATGSTVSGHITVGLGANLVLGSTSTLFNNHTVTGVQAFDVNLTAILVFGVAVLKSGQTNANYLQVVSVPGLTFGYFDCFLYPAKASSVDDPTLTEDLGPRLADVTAHRKTKIEEVKSGEWML